MPVQPNFLDLRAEPNDNKSGRFRFSGNSDKDFCQLEVVRLEQRHEEAWSRFVEESSGACLYHRLEWRQIMERTTPNCSLYLMALEQGQVQGVLPLMHIKSRFFGNMLVSLPYLNAGGVCASNRAAQDALLDAAGQLLKEKNAGYVELRHTARVEREVPTNLFKVAYRIPLDADPEKVWMESLHSNVRNKVRKAEKNGITFEEGRHLVNEFYKVYSHNLRDLGTPVLPKRFFRGIENAFGERCRFYVARLEGKPVAAKLVIYDKKTVYFIWAAAIRKHMRLGVTPYLNWQALKDACLAGMLVCDMGRSTKGSTQENFKKYWGGQEHQLYWQYVLPDGTEEMPGLNPTNPKFAMAIRIWKKLPVPITRLIGPSLAVRLP